MERKSKIYVAGHNGMVGSAIVKTLNNNNYNNLIIKTKEQLDLTQQHKVDEFFKKEKPEYVFLAAAKVGGIYANDNFRAEFLYQNLFIQNNVIHAAYKNNIKKLLFLGSACIYPRLSKQPIKEKYLLTGELEKTNEPYAIAKIAGVKLCENYYYQYGCNFISVMPNNLYGPNDNFNLKTSHVIPALIRKIHDGKISNKKTVEIWGSGKALREFLFVNDLAEACIFTMNNINADKLYSKLKISHINIGSGEELSIRNLANLIKEEIDYDGELIYNLNEYDGTPRKLLDSSLINRLGWTSKIKLKEGIKKTYQWFLLNINEKS